jgi:hypothetical protein
MHSILFFIVGISHDGNVNIKSIVKSKRKLTASNREKKVWTKIYRIRR